MFFWSLRSPKPYNPKPQTLAKKQKDDQAITEATTAGFEMNRSWAVGPQLKDPQTRNPKRPKTRNPKRPKPQKNPKPEAPKGLKPQSRIACACKGTSFTERGLGLFEELRVYAVPTRFCKRLGVSFGGLLMRFYLDGFTTICGKGLLTGNIGFVSSD